MKDLVILVPDKNVKAGLDSLLKRIESFDIREISYDIFIHPYRDPGIVKDAHNFLRAQINMYKYAIVCLDFNGSGFENLSIEELEFEISSNLNKKGWQARSEVIVFDPECEEWFWVQSNSMAEILGWKNYIELKKELYNQKFLKKDAIKPDNPKDAFEYLLRLKKIPRSSSIYERIAEKVSLKNCQSKSLAKFQNTLKSWFPKD